MAYMSKNLTTTKWDSEWEDVVEKLSPNLDRTLKSTGAQDSQNNTNADCSPERLVRVQSMVSYRNPRMKERLREAYWQLRVYTHPKSDNCQVVNHNNSVALHIAQGGKKYIPTRAPKCTKIKNTALAHHILGWVGFLYWVEGGGMMICGEEFQLCKSPYSTFWQCVKTQHKVFFK